MSNIIECLICHKEFTSKRSLSIHIKTHNKENNCIYCNFDFASKQSLDRHIKTCLSKREDETNVHLSFTKRDGKTSYGFLIPEDI